MHIASFVYMVYQPCKDADPYGASRFHGKEVRGELDQTVLEHTLRNIFYRIQKGRQPCHDAPYSEVFYWLEALILKLYLDLLVSINTPPTPHCDNDLETPRDTNEMLCDTLTMCSCRITKMGLCRSIHHLNECNEKFVSAKMAESG
ncbi:jg5048 [Pararge aegeria aegeria]|uniref:Jg5048 protein n=1 Tax=Pararge aegeria aegeria TaxID=348720 RepID=A0A8S4SAM1_9NEOP|nr:jg5048 [Pararge aegeria aegeria]